MTAGTAVLPAVADAMAPVNVVSVIAWVALAVLATAIAGLAALRLLARRSIRLHVGLVAVVCVITAMITIGEIDRKSVV